jgi:preprotein translocase SecE subunit
MTTAVKNSPETTKGSLFDRLPVAVLAGIVYLLASIAVVFKAIPTLFASVSYSGLAVQAIVMVAVAAVLIYVGARLAGPHPARGLFPGIFVGLCFLLIVAFLASWVGSWLEARFFDGWFLGSSQTTGTIAAIVVSLGLLYLSAWLFLRRGMQSFMGGVDDQGWFSVRTYKRTQGLRVRRGTILGILLLVGSGVYIMVERARITPDSDWTVEVPFTGTVDVTTQTIPATGSVASVRKLVSKEQTEANDVPFKNLISLTKSSTLSKDDRDKIDQALKNLVEVSRETEKPVNLAQALPATEKVVKVDRYDLRDFNEKLKQEYVKVTKQGGAGFEAGDVVTESDLSDSRGAATLNDPEKKPQSAAPDDVGGKVQYQSLTLLPHTKYTLPLLIGAVALWFAWRIVNVPIFADFLIATEAELNKVSWTTRRRLIQDTVVVLVTVLLMALFLFAADAIWSAGLKWIQVLKPAPQDSKEVQEPPW